jgi:signal peptidase I
MKKIKPLSRLSQRWRHQELPPEETDLAGRPAGPPGQPVLAGQGALCPDQDETSEDAEDEPSSQQADKPWTPVAFVAAKLVLVISIIWLVFSQFFALTQVSGNDMYPRIMDGDLVMAYRLERSYAQDDVVLFNKSGYKYVGRIVAQGGDVVDLTEDGSLVVNGSVQEEEIFYITEPAPGAIIYPYTVPEDSYFILCDYRTIGVDSRYFGAVSRSDLIGKVFSVLRSRGV